MAFITDVQGAEASCAQVFSDMLVAFMASNGWSKVETYTSGAQTAEVMKSSAGDNGGVDYYVVVFRNADNVPGLRLCLGETYDSGTHKLGRYVPNSTNAAPEATTYTWDSGGQVPIADNMTSNKILHCVVNIAAAGFSYWISCNAKRLIVATRVTATDYQVYAGMVENLLNTTDHPSSSVALLLSMLDAAGAIGEAPSRPSYNAGGMTREPGQGSSLVSNFAVGCQPSDVAFVWPSLLYIPTYDPVYQSGHIATRIFGRGSRSMVYEPRFLLPADCIAALRPNSVHGDTVSIGAKTYVQMGPKMFVDDSV